MRIGSVRVFLMALIGASACSSSPGVLSGGADAAGVLKDAGGSGGTGAVGGSGGSGFVLPDSSYQAPDLVGAVDSNNSSDVVLSFCGNGILEDGESCDDGNAKSGDGCDGTCKVETGYVCPTAGQPCTSILYCGDGLPGPDESCDDGNVKSGDGCSSTCAV